MVKGDRFGLGRREGENAVRLVGEKRETTLPLFEGSFVARRSNRGQDG
jgi:hypothetical protein